MITPSEIQLKEFAKAVRGYKEEEVDAFLDQITADMERLISENDRLKQEVAKLEADNMKYRGSEGAVLETLEAAKALMGDISASAEKRAAILLKNAELDAEMITREAKEEAEKIREENQDMSDRFNKFREKFKTLLEAELDRFDTLSSEIFNDMDIAGFTDLEPSIRAAKVSQGTKGLSNADLSKTRIMDFE